MAGLMSRAATIIKAKISALLNRAESPSETLDYSYERQLESLQNVKRGVADVVTAKKRLQLQTQQLEQNVVKLEAQVRIGEAATGIGRQLEDTGLAIQRAKDKTEQMQARAAAIDELVQTGGLEDLTSGQTQLDRELAQLSSQTQVDQELERLRVEVGAGSAPQKELAQAESQESEPGQEPQPAQE